MTLQEFNKICTNQVKPLQEAIALLDKAFDKYREFIMERNFSEEKGYKECDDSVMNEGILEDFRKLAQRIVESKIDVLD